MELHHQSTPAVRATADGAIPDVRHCRNKSLGGDGDRPELCAAAFGRAKSFDVLVPLIDLAYLVDIPEKFPRRRIGVGGGDRVRVCGIVVYKHAAVAAEAANVHIDVDLRLLITVLVVDFNSLEIWGFIAEIDIYLQCISIEFFEH